MSLRLAALSLLTLCAAARAAQESVPQGAPAPVHDGRGMVAVLRRDGLMFPFATFTDNRWQVTWPLNMTALPVPVTLDAIPRRWWGPRPPAVWRAHLSGGEVRELDLTTPVLSRTFCSRRLWLATNYRSSLQLPPRPVDPFPKDGLVVGGDVPIEPIETVDRASAEWSALAAKLLDPFNRVEEETVRGVRLETRWRHPIAPDVRHRTPVRLESWYRSPAAAPGVTVSYIESVRAYPPGPDDKGCGLETLVSGWLFHENGEIKRTSGLRGKITYCDRVGATYMLPFGRIRPKDKSYWIFQLSGWESEWYDVAEIGRDRVRHVIEVFAGGRAGCF